MIGSVAAGRQRSFRHSVVSALPLVVALLAVPACADVAGETERLVRLLEIGPGSAVADVGAGDGKWSEALAGIVGPDGHVYATEIENDMVEDLGKRLARRGLENVTALLGDQAGSGLPDRCCDALLLRMVYHHFEDPGAMRASLARALRPSGLVAVVDIRPQHNWRRLDGVPERGGHGIDPDELAEEMTADGFELVARHDDWNGERDRYCLVFRSPAESGSQ